jgi:hypothetical protein
MQINYRASQRATNVIAAMGRTEDLKFSPSNTACDCRLRQK